MADVTSPFGFPYPENTDLVRDGASDIESLAEAVNDQFAAGFQYAGTRYYTSSGSFAKADPLGTGDIGLRAIRVRMVGGGGGGGGCSVTGAGVCSVAGSGGGAAYAESFITDIASLATSVTVTRGGGGTGGSAGNNNGATGGTSSFGALVTADGGLAGSGRGTDAFGGLGGTSADGAAGGTGDLVISGSGAGSILHVLFDGARQFVATSGGSLLGAGRRGGTTTTGAAGVNGFNFGSGGTGAVNSENQASGLAGGAGSNGIVIIDCFV